MIMPTKYDVALPVLNALKNGESIKIRSLVPALAKELGLITTQIEERLDSGEPRFANRARWAAWELEKAGLLMKTGRGEFTITEAGLEVLKSLPDNIDPSYLLQFEKYQKVVQEWRGETTDSEVSQEMAQVPEEDIIQSAHRQYNEKLASDLLESVLAQTPEFFEHLVIDLIVAIMN